LGSGESDDDKGEEKILSRGIESLIGALYLDQGLETVEQMVQRKILKE
jgi:dsRNA-specific ribonuclease